jgi:pimeloyl-ACP methyl ester carboxylesterase
VKLAFRESGDPKGLPVVLLHAFPMSSLMWEPQLSALHAYRVLAPDFRGFGGSPLQWPWFVEHAVDDVVETLEAARVEKAVFVGLSMGGYVALRAIEKKPTLVRALVLCDTRAEPDANENKIKRAAAVDFIRSHGVPAFLEPFLKDGLYEETHTRRPSVVDFLRKAAAAASPDAVVSALAALAARGDATPALGKIVVPTLVMVGSHDKLTPLTLAESMRTKIPGAELHVVPDAGHFSNVENPAVFNERLLSFLKRL